MNTTEFAAYGLNLATCVSASARNPKYDLFVGMEDEFLPEALARASAFKARTERVQALLSLPENAQKISGGPLLLQAAELPFDITSLEDHVVYFERLCDAIEEYLGSRQSWDEYLGANRPRLQALWEEPGRRDKEDQEKLLRGKERIQEEFIQNLARAKACVPQPRRDAPCFATTTKSGLNCSRKTLVGILQLPPPLPPKNGEVSVKRCTECWQIYKEFREVDASTHQSRSRFLRPGQSDSALGYDFSPSEADEFEKIDFAAILHPVLKSEPPMPLRSFMLYDMHPVRGGRALWAVEGSRAITQTAAARYANPGDELWERRKRIRLSAQELAGVEQFAAERRFFSLAIEHRPGLPDEKSVVIEMVSKEGLRVRHRKWANTPHPDFDAVHQLLLQLSERIGDCFYEGPMNWSWRPEGVS